MAQPAQERSQESQVSDPKEKFRRTFAWVLLIATTAWGLFAGSFLAYHSMQPDSWLVQIVQTHFAALICVPMAALISMCVVTLLKYSTGPVTFKGLGFEFSGTSGEVVMWVLCFLAVITALKLLW